jgi:hypothetical protein
MLEAAIDRRRIRQNALEQRLGNRYHFQPGGLEGSAGAFELGVAEIENILAVHDTQFGAGHADFLHERQRGSKGWGEFVGNSSNGEPRGEGCHLYT